MNVRVLVTRIALATAAAIAGCGPSANPNPDGGGDMAKPPNNMEAVLDKPADGTGFQLAADPTPVSSGTELQECYFVKVPDVNHDGKPFFVDKIEIAQNTGSHHVNIFRVNTIKNLKGPNPDGTGKVVATRNYADPVNDAGMPPPLGECFKSPNWSDWPLVANNQQGDPGKHYVFQLPVDAAGPVAQKFTPGELLMFQSHFVNASTQTTPAESRAMANFYLLKGDPSKAIELGTFFATNQSISICASNPMPKFDHFCGFPKGMQAFTIVAANGHFHSRGRDFTISTWDGASMDPAAGTQFYESKAWDDPPMTTGLTQQVPAGGGIEFSCTYQYSQPPGVTDPNFCYAFGPTVERFEHCNAFVYYYPKMSTNVTCQ